MNFLVAQKTMRADKYRLSGERGMVLVSALLILSLLLAAGVGARVMLQSDYKILTNLRGSTEAFYLAEAGIAWSKDEIDKSASHPASPANRTHNFASGTFSVSFLSTTALTPLSARIVVRSSGIVRTSTQILQAQMTKTYDLADSAIGLRGAANRVSFAGDSLLISGTDHDPATGEAIGGAKARPAISVSDVSLRGLVEQAAATVQPPGLIESGADTPAISQSPYLPAPGVTGLANELCNSAQAITTVMPAGGALSLQGQTWGTQASPQLRCFEGLSGPGDSVNLAGAIAGAGILVIKNADLVVSGSLRWEGLIIVTGSNVSFKATGAESKEIYGSLMVNETASPESGTAILDIQGRLTLRFSRPALARVVALIPSTALENSYSALPATIKQDYWRLVNP